MTKIDKNANLYDKDGNLLRKAPLKDITIPELEDMIDNYTGDKNSLQYTNMIYMLMDLYNRYGNPHKDELIKRVKALNGKTDEEEVTNALNEVQETVKTYNTNTTESEYVDYEEIKPEGNTELSVDQSDSAS